MLDATQAYMRSNSIKTPIVMPHVVTCFPSLFAALLLDTLSAYRDSQEMSFNYSNPYAAQSSNPFSIPSAPIARSSFLAAVSSGSKGYQLFWSGLPTDIAEGELTVSRVSDANCAHC